MASTLTVVGSLLAIYCVSHLYRLLQNLYYARKSGLPYIIIPWNPNHFLWMVASGVLRPWLTINMPRWIWDRLSLTVYGYEFFEKLRAFEQYAAPQGNDRAYAVVTLNHLEIHTRDAEFVAEVLQRHNDFLPTKESVLFMSKFGHNVLTSTGTSWSRQRKIVASVINERISKTVFDESIQQTDGLLGEVLGQGATGETTRIFDMIKKVTINVLSGAGMGNKVDWADDTEEKPVAPHQQTYIQAVKNVVDAIAGPIIIPTWILLNWPKFLPGHTYLKTVGQGIHEFPIHTSRKLAEEEQRTLTAHGQTSSNIMSQLLQASSQGSDDTTTKSGPRLSEEEVISNLFVFTAAGFDTTVNTLVYALVMLCRYPRWQDWIFEEIDSIMPAGNDSSTPPDYAAIYPKALRVQACMLEVLRLFPPVLHVARMTLAPQQIHTSRGLVKLPANAVIYTHNVGVQIDPDVWRNLNLHPGDTASDTDELMFRPSRWLSPVTATAGTQSQFFKPPKGSYIPWSSGPRVCPGQKMAQVEFTAIFLRLFQAHRIEAVALQKENGKPETSEELADRLDARMKDSFPVLTLQMRDVYDVREGDEKGLKVKVLSRC